MVSKAVLVAFICAAISAVNSYGLVNVYDIDNDLEPERHSDATRDCNSRECDQSCRRIGFTGGACVGGRCKCDINKLKDLEAERHSDATRSCNSRECDQSCRRIGFPGGACVGDRCKCDIIKLKDLVISMEPATDRNSKEVTAEFMLSSNAMPRACYAWQCSTWCRRAGHISGYCVGSTCYCY